VAVPAADRPVPPPAATTQHEMARRNHPPQATTRPPSAGHGTIGCSLVYSGPAAFDCPPPAAAASSWLDRQLGQPRVFDSRSALASSRFISSYFSLASVCLGDERVVRLVGHGWWASATCVQRQARRARTFKLLLLIQALCLCMRRHRCLLQVLDLLLNTRGVGGAHAACSGGSVLGANAQAFAAARASAPPRNRRTRLLLQACAETSLHPRLRGALLQKGVWARGRA